MGRKLGVVLGAMCLAVGAGTLSAETFPDLDLQGKDGGDIRVSQLRGNVVFLNFWATWCGPCRMELPLLQDLYNKYSDRNFTVLAINVDNDRARVDPFLKKNNLSLPTYFANPLDAAALTANGLPTSIILKPTGEIEKAYIGYDPQIEKQWVEHIEKYLKKRRTGK
jgi:thiol-disulfide isomerase/thioredoxin